jgi:uncharacterized protein (TIGR02145 family)
MSKRTKISIFLLIISGVFLVFSSSCEKDEDNHAPLFNSNLTYGTMTDQEGNLYKTITIGSQTWMAENLRTTLYNDGTIIPNVIRNSEWISLKTGAYCNYNKIDIYGRLYNGYAVNTGKLCPIGWHVPTDEEWTILTTYLGGVRPAYNKLKEAGTTHWKSDNSDASNETGFTALPGGSRNSDGSCGGTGYYGFWWSATAGIYTASFRFIDVEGFVKTGDCDKMLGFSVRCVKD